MASNEDKLEANGSDSERVVPPDTSHESADNGSLSLGDQTQKKSVQSSSDLGGDGEVLPKDTECKSDSKDVNRNGDGMLSERGQVEGDCGIEKEDEKQLRSEELDRANEVSLDNQRVTEHQPHVGAEADEAYDEVKHTGATNGTSSPVMSSSPLPGQAIEDSSVNIDISPREDDGHVKVTSSPQNVPVANGNSMFSEDGYIAVQSFPGPSQNLENSAQEEVGTNMDDENKENEDERDVDDDEDPVKADSSTCTDTSQLANVIVEHVLENAVASFHEDASSVGSCHDLESVEVSIDTVDKKDLTEDSVKNQEFFKDHVAEQDRVISLETDEKQYATNQASLAQEIDGMPMETMATKDINEMTDFQLANENASESNLVMNQMTEDDSDEIVPPRVMRAEEKLKENDDEQVSLEIQRTDDIPKQVLEIVKEMLSHQREEEMEAESRKPPVGGANKIAVQQDLVDDLSERSDNSMLLLTDSRTGDSRHLDVWDETQSPELPDRLEDRMTPPSPPPTPTMHTLPKVPLQSSADQKEEDGVLYTLIPSASQESSQLLRNEERTDERAQRKKSPERLVEDGNMYDRGRPANGFLPQTPPQMVLRAKKEHLSNGYSRGAVEYEDAKRRVPKESQKDQEVIREQMILEKVRKDMAAKEKEMRERMERELAQRQMELNREFFRTEADLSGNINIGASRTPYSESYQPSAIRSEYSLPPNHQDSISVSRIYSDNADLSDSSILHRYQREITEREQQLDVGGDMYATLRKEPHASPEMLNKDQSGRSRRKIDSQPRENVVRNDHALLSEIYSRYNIPPPQYNVSTSFDTSDPTSSRTLSDMEAPPPKSGSVPPFKTLQEQQVGWMRMFDTLEEQHQAELKNQYRRHQEVIFQMQQHMESELFSQQQLLKRKLAAHKEALSKSDSPLPNSSSDRSELAGMGHMTYPNLESTRNQGESVLSSDTSYNVDSSHSSRQVFRSPAFNRKPSPQWREIYREIRGKNVDSDGTTEDTDEGRTTPVNRILKDELMLEMIRSHIRTPEKSPRSPRVQIRTPERSPNSPRSQSRIHPKVPQAETSSGSLPRAGVYSSPMPILRRGNDTQYSLPEAAVSRTVPQPEVSLPTYLDKAKSAPLEREIESRHQRRIESETDEDVSTTETASDDVCMSSSSRVNLREKHAKHLSDLREYYEQELHEMRTALSHADDITNRTPFKHMANENLTLIAENRSLKDKNKKLENEVEKSNKRIQELEQKVYGLEKRASDYADHYKEAQEKISNFRSKMEEIQYSSRSQNDTIQQLEYKIKNQTDAIQHYKKVQEEQHRVIQSDRTAFHKLADKHESLERDHGVLKETLNATENKLYDSRSEIVELNRTVSKLELENKRIGRENDNLHLKLKQPLNISGVHNSINESYGTPPPPPPQQERLLANCQRERSVERTDIRRESGKDGSDSKMKCLSDADIPEVANGDIINNTSPVMRAERELYRLREIMRQAENSTEPIPPSKVKKKYYGSETVSQSRNSDFSKSESRSDILKKSDSPEVRRQRGSRESVNSHIDMSPSKVSHKSRFEVNPDDFRSPTRFDISVKEKKSRPSSSSQGSRNKTSSSSRQKSVPEDKNTVPKTKTKPASGTSNGRKPKSADTSKKNSGDGVESTLDKMHSGDFVARPEWEDIYTSLATSKSPSTKSPQVSTKRQTVEQRIQNITDMERRYDDLNIEKKKLEAMLSRVPMHGKGRQEKEHLEEKLDGLEKELGSVRMSLKRYHVLKTSI